MLFYICQLLKITYKVIIYQSSNTLFINNNYMP